MVPYLNNFRATFILFFYLCIETIPIMIMYWFHRQNGKKV